MKIIAELIFLLSMAVLNIVLLLQIEEFPQEGWDELGPAAYPRLLLLVMLAILIYLIFRTLFKLYKSRQKGDLEVGKEKLKRSFHRYKKVIISIVLFLVYMLVIDLIGFRFSTFGYLIITQWILSSRRKKVIPKILLAAILIGFGIPFFFETYLGVMFPRGFLFQ